MSNKRILGLDIGITSVGWGIIDENNQILKAGVRLFEEADSDNNTKRRSFRGQRRLKNRRKLRILDMRQLLYANQIIPTIDYKPLSNPYESRIKGLSSKLTNDELASTLIQFSKRRGSNLETVEESKNDASPKFVLQKHDVLLGKDRHIVHLQLDSANQVGKIRGHENIYRTSQYEAELLEILTNQELSKEFISKAIQIIRRRRHFSEGPGNLNSPTPFGRFRSVDVLKKQAIIQAFNNIEKAKYKKEKFVFIFEGERFLVLTNGDIINQDPLNLIDIMRGKCSIYPDELRAPKNALSAELYNLLNDLNNLTIISQENRRLSKNEKELVISQLLANGYFKPKGAKGLLKLLNLDLSNVKGFRVNAKDEPLITELEGYFKVKKVIISEDNVKENNVETFDRIAEILTSTLVIEERANLLKTLNLSLESVKGLSELSGMNGYHAFSLKALNTLNKELLEDSFNAQQIITLTDKLNIQNKLAVSEGLILSPVARRAHQEAFKVVEGLMNEFGYFDRIVIETTRDKNSKEQAANIRDRQKKQEKSKLEAEIELRSMVGDTSIEVKPIMIQKMRLYKEQNGKCAYTGMLIDLKKLITDSKAYEVDHIIPYSISLDDSYNNKVLITPLVNQLKGNRTPFGYFKSGKMDSRFPIQNYEMFKEIVMNNPNLSKYKKANLLDERDVTKFDVMKEFINRNLVDTSYAVRTFMMTLKQYFENRNISTSVTTIKGKQTDLFRGIASTQWYREHKEEEHNPFKKDRNFYSHHAVDALIIAGLSNQKLFKYLINMEKSDHGYVYDAKTGELFETDPKQDGQFVLFTKSIACLKPNDIRYSWKKDTKPNRSISDQTIYSTRNYDGNDYVIKKYKNIYEMKKEDLAKIFEDEKKKQSLLIYMHDRVSFDLIEKAYHQYKHEPKPFLTYENEHGKIRKHGKKVGAIITDLKYKENQLGNNIDITGNTSSKKKVVLLQVSPYRIDLYQSKEGLYKFVTIRYNDMRLKNGKFEIDTDLYFKKLKDKKIDSNYDFLYSFHRNEIIEIQKDDQLPVMYRFIVSKSDSTNVIELKPIDFRSEERITPIINKSIKRISKYHTNTVGKLYIANKETLKMQI